VTATLREGSSVFEQLRHHFRYSPRAMAVGFAWEGPITGVQPHYQPAASALGGPTEEELHSEEGRTTVLWNREGEEVSLLAMPAATVDEQRRVRLVPCRYSRLHLRYCHVRGCGCAACEAARAAGSEQESRRAREAPCID
jgi:hypothetical protein